LVSHFPCAPPAVQSALVAHEMREFCWFGSFPPHIAAINATDPSAPHNTAVLTHFIEHPRSTPLYTTNRRAARCAGAHPQEAARAAVCFRA